MNKLFKIFLTIELKQLNYEVGFSLRKTVLRLAENSSQPGEKCNVPSKAKFRFDPKRN